MSLINREALLSYADLWASCGEHYTAEDVIMMIKTAPTADAVPVVRCKDCRHMEKSQYGRYCQIWRMYNGHGDDGFCCYGERKGGAE